MNVDIVTLMINHFAHFEASLKAFIVKQRIVIIVATHH
jgi:hypothetical protein